MRVLACKFAIYRYITYNTYSHYHIPCRSHYVSYHIPCQSPQVDFISTPIASRVVATNYFVSPYFSALPHTLWFPFALNRLPINVRSARTCAPHRLPNHPSDHLHRSLRQLPCRSLRHARICSSHACAPRSFQRSLMLTIAVLMSVPSVAAHGVPQPPIVLACSMPVRPLLRALNRRIFSMTFSPEAPRRSDAEGDGMGGQDGLRADADVR
jgi:hypothetical protein